MITRRFEASVVELPNGHVVVTAADFDESEWERRGDTAQDAEAEVPDE